MIFVVETPPQAAPAAWFAFDAEDLRRKLEARAGLPPADALHVFWDEAEATAAFERPAHPLWAAAGWRARAALRDQLVATEVLSDDL